MTSLTAPLVIPDIVISGDGGGYGAKWGRRDVEPGVAEFDIEIAADACGYPPEFRVDWRVPAVDIHARWHPGTYLDKALLPDYAKGFVANATALAPVMLLHNMAGVNRLCFSVSDALNATVLHAGIHEDTSTVACRIQLFTQPRDPFERYEVVLRVDARPLPYEEVLRQVSEWWAMMPGMKPAVVPVAAKLPLYSTWYSYHQAVSAESVESECNIAAELGFTGVIVDDGWQTDAPVAGYASCGDWEPALSKFPDMKTHVDRVHAMGLTYLLWFSVPHVGERTNAYERLKNMTLGRWIAGDAWVLDPRFPEVREYLISVYEKAVRLWGLDGLKLDFVDSFRSLGLVDSTAHELGGGRDVDSVAEAVDTLLSQTLARLREINPDVMVEFRQSYIGPFMRAYGTMFRAADCPNDSLRNRVSTLDVRAIAGNTPVHSDMLMWNIDEAPENVALQFSHVMFSVAQVSVKLMDIPSSHRRVVEHWLRFGEEFRELLLDAPIHAESPEMNYPLVSVRDENTVLVADYGRGLVRLGDADPRAAIIVNGTHSRSVIVVVSQLWIGSRVQLVDAEGNTREYRGSLSATTELPVPVGGYARVWRVGERSH